MENYIETDEQYTEAFSQFTRDVSEIRFNLTNKVTIAQNRLFVGLGTSDIILYETIIDDLSTDLRNYGLFSTGNCTNFPGHGRSPVVVRSLNLMQGGVEASRIHVSRVTGVRKGFDGGFEKHKDSQSQVLDQVDIWLN